MAGKCSMDVDTASIATVYDDATDLAIGLITYAPGCVLCYQAAVGLPGARRVLGWHRDALAAMDEIVAVWRHESRRTG